MFSCERKIPTLVELCIQTAIDNIRYIGDVGETDIYLLKDILPHCTLDQLMHIENSSKGRDLCPVTDDLWKKFYQQHFGVESANLVIKRMKQKKVVFKWRLLYEAKLKERDEAEKKSIIRLKERYAQEGLSGGAGNSLSNVKGNLMKKAKMEYINSHEARVYKDMKKKELQRNSFSPPSVSRAMKPSGYLGKSPASSSKINKPFGR